MPAESLWGFLALIILISAALSIWRKMKIVRRQLKDEWGTGGRAYAMDEDAMIALRECHRDIPEEETAFAWVDEVPWADLDMDAIFRYLNRTQSGVGEEALFRMLHAIDADGSELLRRDRWMNALRDDEDNRLALQRQLRKLGREHDHGAFSYLKDPLASKPKHGWVFYALAGLPFVFAGLGFANPYWLLGILASFAVNAAVYYRTKKVWMRELSAVRHIAAVLRIGRRMGRVTVRGAEDGFAQLHALSAKLKVFGRWNAIFNMQRVADY
ncbi:MAG: hypothetical protein IH607_05430, partial [Firmicutes bacterium]|nr:hypothetical protein [Bacillota bacterium]